MKKINNTLNKVKDMLHSSFWKLEDFKSIFSMGQMWSQVSNPQKYHSQQLKGKKEPELIEIFEKVTTKNCMNLYVMYTQIHMYSYIHTHLNQLSSTNNANQKILQNHDGKDDLITYILPYTISIKSFLKNM